jgi:hypothetical protein
MCNDRCIGITQDALGSYSRYLTPVGIFGRCYVVQVALGYELLILHMLIQHQYTRLT